MTSTTSIGGDGNEIGVGNLYSYKEVTKPTNEIITETTNEIILGMEWLGTFEDKLEATSPANKRKADAIMPPPTLSPSPIPAAMAVGRLVSILRPRHLRRWKEDIPDVIILPYPSEEKAEE
jgi:hypothetical protein